jgi:hypothetical protein
VGAVQFDIAKVWIWPGSAGEPVVAIEGVVQNGGAHLEHEVGASRRPPHLLLGVHPPVQKALDHPFARCARERLRRSQRGRVVDDRDRLARDMDLEIAQVLQQSVGAGFSGSGFQPGELFPDQIEGSLHLAVPQPPADVLDAFGERGAVAPIGFAVARPALRRLSGVLKAHGQMEPVQHVAGRSWAGLFAQGPWPIGAIADNRHRCRRGSAELAQNCAELRPLATATTDTVLNKRARPLSFFA